MKIIVIVLSLLNGLYMLADGVYVLLNNKYIGPEKPGPWANIFSSLNIDVFKIGPLFITYGVGWLCFVIAYLYNMSWAFSLGIAMSVLTLWYLPAGTIFSLIVLVLLIVLKKG
ncbi:hypothetical protein GCM10027049_15640 [Mucilaginibacter puniceus]